MESDSQSCVKKFEAIPNLGCITGDCGFLLNYQKLVLELCPKCTGTNCIIISVILFFNSISARKRWKNIITADSSALQPIFWDLLNDTCDISKEITIKKFKILCTQNILGFGKEVKEGLTVDIPRAETSFTELIDKT